ncbi:unnamed protein product [Porites evermanni]|uniref:PLAT domain-containing protein n=1 Tax=Porites evermanni TaxID=104178 RepID=A0ABN8MFF5_9CNID|nr:unnamed protein product [Porites evermanni]
MIVGPGFRLWVFTLTALYLSHSIGYKPSRVREYMLEKIIKRSSKTVLYRVSVTTADDEIGTGTDADVFIQIFGEKGNTSVVELTKSGNLFESGQKDEFTLVENFVGTLTKVGIKRNEKGLFDAWKLAMITVQPAGSLVYKFQFNEWIKPNEWTYSYGG